MRDKQLIKSVRSENPAIATVAVKIDDPRVVLVKGEKAGFTRVSLTDRDNNTEAYEIFVGKTGDQLRQEFLSLARRAVPTAIVDVIPSGATVVLTGTVPHAADIQILMEIARGLFPGANIINGMRIGGVQQVQLEVFVAAVKREQARNMAFDFGEFGNNHFISSTVGNTTTGSTGLNSPLSFAGSVIGGMARAAGFLAGTPNLTLGIVNDQQGFLGFLQALRTENLAKIMAQPTVTTLSGRPARIIDGGLVPTVATSVAGANVTYIPFGTVVDVLPIVLGDGKIHLEVHPIVSAPSKDLALTVTGTNPVSAPGFTSREVISAVRVEDGQTVAIGGLIQNTVNGTTNKIPILGDLPFIGAAFRTVSYDETEEELLILVTPRLIDPMSCDQLPKLMPGQETRSPDDFELFLEGILEAPRGQRVVSFPGYMAAYRNSPSAERFPCGNGSCGPGGVPPVAGPSAPPVTVPQMPAQIVPQVPSPVPPQVAPQVAPQVLPQTQENVPMDRQVAPVSGQVFLQEQPETQPQIPVPTNPAPRQAPR
jgi:pilus assembly protein CpaC